MERRIEENIPRKLGETRKEKERKLMQEIKPPFKGKE